MHKIIFVSIGCLYIIPILQLALFFVPHINSNIVRSFNSFFGRIEWTVRFVRDSIVFLLFIVYSVFEGYHGRIESALYPIPFILLSISSIARRKMFLRKIAVFAKENPNIHPKEFFKCYYSGFGFIPAKYPLNSDRTIDPLNLSFKTGGEPKKRFLPLIFGFLNTCSLANIIVASHKWKGPSFARTVAQSVSSIWGARILQLANLSLKVSGFDILERLDGKKIFAVTHKGYLDFAVAPLIFRSFNLRFLAARDHFLDNPILYFIMGRAMRLVGTVFVDRKSKRRSAKLVSQSAAEALSELAISLLIFPQGTRAHSAIAANRKRLDAGYYTSGDKERLLKPDGHIKKGTAYIAIDTALRLKEKEKFEVNIVPVAIINTGLASPKGKIAVQTETDISVRIGDPISITKKEVLNLNSGDENYAAFVENVHESLDIKLKSLLELHAYLEQRFFKDVRGLIPAGDMEHVSVAMKAWRGKDYLIYTLLDCIYATHPDNWPVFLRELCYLLVSDAPVATFTHFKERIIDKM